MTRHKRLGNKISKPVRELTRDRMNELIDDKYFINQLENIIIKNSNIRNLYCDIGMSLAKWVANYVYILTNDIDHELAREKEHDWSIVMRWGTNELKYVYTCRLTYLRLESPSNKDFFEQHLTNILNESERDYEKMKCMRAAIIGGALDYFFKIADEVNHSIRQDFLSNYVIPMSM